MMTQKLAKRCPGWGLVAIVALVLAGCGGGDDQQQQAQQQDKPPRKAQVIAVKPQDLELDKEYPALVRSDQAATIVARVDGVLEEQHYQAGERVEKGQKLFTIEQAPYIAVVRQRKADVQSAQATVNNTRRDFQRYDRLVKQGSISQQQRDSALNDYETARASLAEAQAALDDAQIDLDYTTVEAPVDGVVGLNYVNVGNYVAAQTELTSVTPVNPLEVRFSLPQEDAFALRQQRQMMGVPTISAQLRFPYAGQSDTTSTTLSGELNFLGSRVDEDTSTVQARAVFDNPDDLFLPGQFVRVKLQDLKRFNVLAVPETSVTEGLKGPQIFLLNQDNVVQNRFVSLGEQANGWIIITEGLQKGDRVVVSDIGSINPGDKIDPQPFDGNPVEEPDDPSGKKSEEGSQPSQGVSASGDMTQQSAEQSSSDE